MVSFEINKTSSLELSKKKRITSFGPIIFIQVRCWLLYGTKLIPDVHYNIWNMKFSCDHAVFVANLLLERNCSWIIYVFLCVILQRSLCRKSSLPSEKSLQSKMRVKTFSWKVKLHLFPETIERLSVMFNCCRTSFLFDAVDAMREIFCVMWHIGCGRTYQGWGESRHATVI